VATPEGRWQSRHDPQGAWREFQAAIAQVSEVRGRLAELEVDRVRVINESLEEVRRELQALEADGHQAVRGALDAERDELLAEHRAVQAEMRELRRGMDARSFSLELADGESVTLPLSSVIAAYRPNMMSSVDKVEHWLAAVWDFLSTGPREANTEGGVYPAIVGTVVMVLVMSLLVTPFGVIAAVYLHEYARQDWKTRLIRIAVNNLAGVPSIVYGVFGLGFFIYVVGGEIDRLFFPEALPAPTFGAPGLLWASVTLALLTLPVVIVATEEGLARIPNSLREGSFALGATRYETLRNIILPIATPAMMTGVILAIARAAGEVAPLMLVGVVKLAPALPIDGHFPYLHLDQKFMHLGYHVFDVGFQSTNIEAARPLVYATALLLVLLTIGLNITAVLLRNRLRERYKSL
jgi:phosphate transport system permease protein